MTFLANTVVRNDGRKGSLGIAAQAAPGVYVPPTNFLRETGGTGAMPDFLERVSGAFRGTSFESPAEYAGTDFMNRSTPGEATIADLALMARLMYGEPDAGGIITPQDAVQWADNLPLQPFSGQWRIPGAGYTQFKDGQLYELSVAVPESRTEFVTATANFHAAWADHHAEDATYPVDGFTPTPPITPAYSGGLGRINHTLSFDGLTICPDGASTARFYNPVEALPACGANVAGFAPGTDPIGVEFAFGFNKPLKNLLAANKAKTFMPIVWTLSLGSKLFQVTANCQVSAREITIAPGRVKTTGTFRARSTTPGVSPFSIKTVLV